MPAPTFRPRLDGLEDRLAPATFTVTNTNDNGAGSLRAALNSANNTAGADTIQFSIGTGKQVIRPTKALPAVTETVTIDASTQPGVTTTPLVVLNGKGAGVVNGLEVKAGADNCTIKSLVINNFGGNGIVLRSDGNNVRLCYIGTNPTGTAGAGNGLDGIVVKAGSSGNTIGGNGFGNLIAANFRHGVFISGAGADGNTVAGNSIGNNVSAGVAISAGAQTNTVGGNAAGLGNVIGANGGNGIWITGAGTNGNAVAGNFIGTNGAGSQAVANLQNGVLVEGGASNNSIGVAGAGNLISGNSRNGVNIRGAGTNGNTLTSNFVGLDGGGKAAIANGEAGVRIVDGATGTVIGGSTNGTPNTISGNKSFGVVVSGADQTVIRGNRIGTDLAGTTAVGNGSHGVFVTGGASKTTVGGTSLSDGNLIANNAGNGVLIGSDPAAGFSTAAGTGNSVLSSAFAANGRLGIDVGPNDGVTAPPVTVTSAVAAADKSTIDVAVAVTGAAGATFRVEVYVSTDADPSGFGEGRFLLGVIQVTTTGTGPTAGTGTLQFSATAGMKITATATNLGTNETSEFSAAVTAT